MSHRALSVTFVVLTVAGSACSSAGPVSSPPGSQSRAELPTYVSPGPPQVARSSATDFVDADAAEPKCEVVCGAVQVAVLKGGVIAEPDADTRTTAETENANAVLNEKNEDLLRCYKPHARAFPQAQGSVTFDLLIGADGRVMKIATEGGERLGPVKECMIEVLRGCEFAPPHGGGTLSIRAPYTLRAQSLDESI